MATAIETKALRVSFVYTDGRLPPTRIVTVGPAAAHEILISGVAQIADEQSFEVYGAWCEAEDVEPVDTEDWDPDLEVYQAVHDRQAEETEDAPDIAAWEDDGGAEVVGSIEPDGADGAEAEVDPGGADSEASAAIDLRETPVRALRDALAAIDDLSVLEALAKSDDRNSAARHYKARIAELQVEDTGADQDDG